MAVQLLEDWLLKEQEKIITTYRELNQAPLKEPGLIFIGDSIVAKINQTNATIDTQTASLLDMLSQLHGTTPEADAELKKFVQEFKG